MGDALRQFKSEIFQGLANPTRIAIVELLRGGELSAGKLIEELGIEQANVSQHLAVLRARQIVVNRKVGNHVFYSIRDHALIEVLDILRRYFYSQLSSTVSMMKRIAAGRLAATAGMSAGVSAPRAMVAFAGWVESGSVVCTEILLFKNAEALRRTCAAAPSS